MFLVSFESGLRGRLILDDTVGYVTPSEYIWPPSTPRTRHKKVHRRQEWLSNDMMKVSFPACSGGRGWHSLGPPFGENRLCERCFLLTTETPELLGATGGRSDGGACLCIHWRLKWFSLTWQHNSAHIILRWGMMGAACLSWSEDKVYCYSSVFMLLLQC